MRITRLIVVDIETDIPEPKGAIDNSEPFLMGMKPFSVRKGELKAGRFRYFEQKNFEKGARKLRKFKGPIVGYNLLGFDYVVLRNLVNVAPFFKCTVDLLEFLKRKIGSRRGLKLHKVCMELFGEGKLLEDARGLADMWKAGKREKVLRYNERDCDLTARLWFQLRNSRRISIQRHSLRFNQIDHLFLDGKRPVVNHKEWLREHFQSQPDKVRVDQFQGLHENPLDLAREYDRYVCKNSGTVMFTRLIPANEIPSGEDIAPRYCPACGKYVFHSAYVFKREPTIDGKPVDIPRLEKLWAMIRHLLIKRGEPPVSIFGSGAEGDPFHFLIEGVPRRESLEAGCYDDSGIDEQDITLWVRQVQRKPGIKKFCHRFRTTVSYTTKRTLWALTREAMKQI